MDFIPYKSNETLENRYYQIPQELFDKWYLLLTKNFLIELESKKQKDILMNAINLSAITKI